MSTLDKEALDPDDPRHGTECAYTYLGCRCEACREARSIRCRERYQAQKLKPARPITPLPDEEWRPVPNFERWYEVSNHGRVRSLDRRGEHRNGRPFYRGQLLKPGKSRRGRLVVILRKNGEHKQWQLHRLVAEVFIGPCPPGLECCHNDGNHLNNHVSNLRWDTRSSNQLDQVKHGQHVHARKTHCPSGHPYSEENTRWRRTGGRACKTCHRIRSAARKTSSKGLERTGVGA